MRRMLSAGLVLWAGALAVPRVPVSDPYAAAPPCRPDTRVARLESFFATYRSPVAPLAADFIAAADQHDLDWRLLPSIAMVESSGGKYFANNNIFGWDSCRTGFASVREGIYFVAARLANSELYRGKGPQQILRTYNPAPDYDDRVGRFMALLGSP